MININEIHTDLVRLPADELYAAAYDLSESLRRNPDPEVASRLDVALVILSDRIPADVFADLCAHCDIDLESH